MKSDTLKFKGKFRSGISQGRHSCSLVLSGEENQIVDACCFDAVVSSASEAEIELTLASPVRITKRARSFGSNKDLLVVDGWQAGEVDGLDWPESPGLDVTTLDSALKPWSTKPPGSKNGRAALTAAYKALTPYYGVPLRDQIERAFAAVRKHYKSDEYVVATVASAIFAHETRANIAVVHPQCKGGETIALGILVGVQAAASDIF